MAFILLTCQTAITSGVLPETIKISKWQEQKTIGFLMFIQSNLIYISKKISSLKWAELSQSMVGHRKTLVPLDMKALEIYAK
jgi:hypothetical protein